MPSEIDSFEPEASGHGQDIPRNASKNLDVLTATMQAQGFVRHPMEWWHFSFAQDETAPIGDWAPLAAK